MQKTHFKSLTLWHLMLSASWAVYTMSHPSCRRSVKALQVNREPIRSHTLASQANNVVWEFRRAFRLGSYGGNERKGGMLFIFIREAVKTRLLLQVEECTRQLQDAVKSVHSVSAKHVEDKYTSLEAMVHDGLRSIQVKCWGDCCWWCPAKHQYPLHLMCLFSLTEDHWNSNAMWPRTDHCWDGMSGVGFPPLTW